MDRIKTTLKQNIGATDREWLLVDATGQSMGRLAAEIAKLLQGKAKVDFTPHTDGGDYVVVVNIDKMVVTGNKFTDKKYYRHSGYLGNLKTETFKELTEKKPTEAFRLAVSGMLQKNRHRKNRLDRLKLFVGDSHDFSAQKPKLIKF